MQTTHVFAGVPVRELAPGLAWYEDLLGRPPDGYPNDSEAVWNLADGGLVYVVVDPDRAGGGLVTLIVDDLVGAAAELTSRGVEPGEIEEFSSGARKFSVTDPDGNTISFGATG